MIVNYSLNDQFWDQLDKLLEFRISTWNQLYCYKLFDPLTSHYFKQFINIFRMIELLFSLILEIFGMRWILVAVISPGIKI